MIFVPERVVTITVGPTLSPRVAVTSRTGTELSTLQPISGGGRIQGHRLGLSVAWCVITKSSRTFKSE